MAHVEDIPTVHERIAGILTAAVHPLGSCTLLIAITANLCLLQHTYQVRAAPIVFLTRGHPMGKMHLRWHAIHAEPDNLDRTRYRSHLAKHSDAIDRGCDGTRQPMPVLRALSSDMAHAEDKSSARTAIY
jgi:hypothetical protein